MLRKKKFLIGGGVLLAAIGFLVFRGFAGSAVYYYTVSELLDRKVDLAGQTVRVNGNVMAGSVQSSGSNLKFTISDGQKNLPVEYTGVVPDTFKVGNDVVTEGKMDTTVFQASTLMPKCPSRYVPAPG